MNTIKKILLFSFLIFGIGSHGEMLNASLMDYVWERLTRCPLKKACYKAKKSDLLSINLYGQNIKDISSLVDLVPKAKSKTLGSIVFSNKCNRVARQIDLRKNPLLSSGHKLAQKNRKAIRALCERGYDIILDPPSDKQRCNICWSDYNPQEGQFVDEDAVGKQACMLLCCGNIFCREDLKKMSIKCVSCLTRDNNARYYNQNEGTHFCSNCPVEQCPYCQAAKVLWIPLR